MKNDLLTGTQQWLSQSVAERRYLGSRRTKRRGVAVGLKRLHSGMNGRGALMPPVKAIRHI